MAGGAVSMRFPMQQLFRLSVANPPQPFAQSFSVFSTSIRQPVNFITRPGFYLGVGYYNLVSLIFAA